MLASRIGLMQAGKLLLLETPAEFLKSSQPEAQAFLKGLPKVA